MARSWQDLVACTIILSLFCPSELARDDHLLGNKTEFECQSYLASDGDNVCCTGRTQFQFGPPEYEAYNLDYRYEVEELDHQMDIVRQLLNTTKDVLYKVIGTEEAKDMPPKQETTTPRTQTPKQPRKDTPKNRGKMPPRRPTTPVVITTQTVPIVVSTQALPPANLDPPKNADISGWRKRWTEYVKETYFKRRRHTPLVTDLIELTTTTKNFLTIGLLRAGDAADQNPVLWRCMCKFWEKPIARWTRRRREKLPTSLTELLADCIEQVGRKTQDRKAFFGSLLLALKTLPTAATVFKQDDCAITTGPTLSLNNVVLSEDEVSSLVKFFPYLLYLKELKLQMCKINKVGAAKIAEEVHFLKHLENINLFNNDIGDEGAKRLAEKFHLLKQLKELSFQKNSISASGGAAIAENVAHLQALESLTLGINKVASALPNMARAFAKMPHLRSVGLEFLGYQGEEEIAAAGECAREAVDILCGSIRLYRKTATLYTQSCGKNATNTALMDQKWKEVKRVMEVKRNIVIIHKGNLNIQVSLGD